MIFDTHAHYDDEQFDADREELLSGMKAGGVGMIVDAAATVASWDKILELTEKYPFLYGSVGVHPDEVGDLNEENFARMSELADRKKIVAIGEIGLDYYWDKEGHDLQKYWFIRQLELAGEKKLPVMIHSREVWEAVKWAVKPGGGSRYNGDHEKVRQRSKRSDPLLFLFTGDGTGVCENGLLYRSRWCGNF